MPPHRAAAQVLGAGAPGFAGGGVVPGREGVITVTGVPAAEGEVVEVIVIRGSRDADRYASAPVAPAEFSDIDEPLGWDGDGSDEFGHEAR